MINEFSIIIDEKADYFLKVKITFLIGTFQLGRKFYVIYLMFVCYDTWHVL